MKATTCYTKITTLLALLLLVGFVSLATACKKDTATTDTTTTTTTNNTPTTTQAEPQEEPTPSANATPAEKERLREQAAQAELAKLSPQERAEKIMSDPNKYLTKEQKAERVEKLKQITPAEQMATRASFQVRRYCGCRNIKDKVFRQECIEREATEYKELTKRLARNPSALSAFKKAYEEGIKNCE